MDEIEQNGKKYTYFRVIAEAKEYDADYLRRLAKSGKIDAIRIGSAWMINRESLEEYQKAQKNRHPHKS